jgi:hypothetical protein
VFYGLEYHSSTSYVPTAPRLTTLRNELNTQHLATSPRHFADASLFVVSKNSQFGIAPARAALRGAMEGEDIGV